MTDCTDTETTIATVVDATVRDYQGGLMTTERFFEGIRSLSDDDQATVLDVVEGLLREHRAKAAQAPTGARDNIGQPFSLPESFDVSGTLDWLEQVEQSTGEMTAEECAAELEAYECDVFLQMTSPWGAHDPNDKSPCYTVSLQSRSLLGLQWLVARERFMESLTAAREALKEGEELP